MSTTEIVLAKDLQVGEYIFIQSNEYKMLTQVNHAYSEYVIIRWGNHPSQERMLRNEANIERMIRNVCKSD